MRPVVQGGPRSAVKLSFLFSCVFVVVDPYVSVSPCHCANPDGDPSPVVCMSVFLPVSRRFQPLNLLIADDGSCVVMDVGSACPARREVGGTYSASTP